METAGLLVNLVFAYGAALIGAVVAARLRQSIILGYILAGIAIGPFTPGFVADRATVEALADIGIIFLLFAVGVQLSLRDLLRVGTIAIGGGSLQVLVTIGLGYLIGVALGWSPLESLFFGAVLSNSSSTVLSKILDERGEMESEHGQIGLAWSTVQDLSTIVLVVVLSALAAGSQSLVADLGWALLKAALFMAVLVLAGSRVLPYLFEHVAALRSREVFILAVAAVALGTAYVSSLFGLSLALGAFVAGVVVGESDLSHQILGEILPLRDILAGLFFVSVGMLVNPFFVVENLVLVLLTLALIVVAKGLLVAAITWFFRRSAHMALLTGVTLAQSAEFSFLLARLGEDLGAVSATVFSLMMAGTAASIVVSPSLHRIADPAARWLERRLPESPLAHLPAAADLDCRPRRHAVICGFGRVGRVVGVALRRRGFSFVVIEQDQRLVRRLREQGVPALLGHADNPVLLERANVAQARVLVVAIPEALAARQIVDYARRANPRLSIVVRTHSAEEMRFLEDRGVGEAVLGELELALELTRHTLRRFGVTSAETLAIIQGLRARAPLDPSADSLDLAD